LVIRWEIGGLDFSTSATFEKLPSGTGGKVAVHPVGKSEDLVLLPNYPNPFNPTTFIAYALAEDVYVKLEVFSLLGERVAALVDGAQEAGYHEVRLDGTNMASGVYVYQIRVGSISFSRRMILLE
jgi:hypothetical protein